MKIGELRPKNRQEMKDAVSLFRGFQYDSFNLPDPRELYGVTDADIEFFKYRDVELQTAINRFMGMDFPAHKIDDLMIVELAGMLQKLGMEEALSEFRKLPRRIRALYRCVGRNHKKNSSGG